MEYGKHLYKSENIIGYTGDINNNPTVYFEKKIKGRKTVFGHITQTYPADTKNEGRELVRRREHYKQHNAWVNLNSKPGDQDLFLSSLEGVNEITSDTIKDGKRTIAFESGQVKTFELRAVEEWAPDGIHISRTPFVAISDMDKGDILKLECSLEHKDKKVKFDKNDLLIENKEAGSEPKTFQFLSDKEHVLPSLRKDSDINLLDNFIKEGAFKKDTTVAHENSIDEGIDNKTKIARLAVRTAPASDSVNRLPVSARTNTQTTDSRKRTGKSSKLNI